jgi:V/A-type H+-transporting ATPase subunit D
VEKVVTTPQKIAGVKIPTFKEVQFKLVDFSHFEQPAWVLDGIDVIQKIAILKIKIKVEKRRITTLELARKKTTQKVNLYEKVQIPAYQEAIIKIKRFLEDTENLDRASQKIVKKKRVQIL